MREETKNALFIIAVLTAAVLLGIRMIGTGTRHVMKDKIISGAGEE